MVHVFVRRITRWDEKHFLKTELLPCSFCYDKMTDVYWIERAAEYPYAFRHIYNTTSESEMNISNVMISSKIWRSSNFPFGCFV